MGSLAAAKVGILPSVCFLASPGGQSFSSDGEGRFSF
jgi:hypothetical protein